MNYDQMTKKADGTLLDWLDSNVTAKDADMSDSIVRWGGTGAGAIMGYLLSGLIHRKPNMLLRALYTLGGGVTGNRLSENYIGVKRGTRKMVENKDTGKEETDIGASNGPKPPVSQPSPVTKLIKDHPDAADVAVFGTAGLVHGAKGGARAWDKMVGSTGAGSLTDPRTASSGHVKTAPKYSMSSLTNPVSGLSVRLSMGGKGDLLKTLALYNQAKNHYSSLPAGTDQSIMNNALTEVNKLKKTLTDRYDKRALITMSKPKKFLSRLLGRNRYSLNLDNPTAPVLDSGGQNVVQNTLNSGVRRSAAGVINGTVNGTLAAVLANLVSPRTVSKALDWIPGLQTEKH